MSQSPAAKAADAPAVPAPTRAEERATSRAWMYETPVFYLLLALVQRLAFPDHPGFIDVNPSPFWLGLLVFGLRYGLAPGLVAGVISSGLLALGYWQGGQSYRLEDTEFLVRAMLFIVVGAAVGGVASGFRHHLATLRANIADQLDRVRGLQGQILAQQKALRAVEQQVVSQMSSVVTLYHGSRELGTTDREIIFNGILEFFSRALQADRASLYIPSEGGWTLRGQKGWPAADTYPTSVGVGQGLVGKSGAERRVTSLRDWFEPKPDGTIPSEVRADAIMAAPLRAPSGEVLAVYAVQSMPFLSFNSASVNLLSLLAEWGDEALAKCLHFENLRSKSIMDEDLPVYGTKYFEARSRQEFSRSKRHALPLSIALVSPRGHADLPVDGQVSYFHALAKLLNECVRDSDVVTKSPFPEAPFAMLLMTTTREQVAPLKQRVLEAHSRLGLPVTLAFGVGSFRHEMTSLEEVFAEARTDLG